MWTWIGWGLATFWFLSWIGQALIIGKMRRLLVLRLLDKPQSSDLAEIVARNDGLYRMGTLYELAKLEGLGLVESYVHPSDPNQHRMYTLTATGKTAARR